MPTARICPHCRTANDESTTFCGACATQLVSTSTALVPTRERGGLPVLSRRDKATIGGVALGVAAMAFRVGAALLKQAMSAEKEKLPAPLPAEKSGSSLRIRRRWVVGDRSGPLRWGEEEIEVQDSDEASRSIRISLD